MAGHRRLCAWAKDQTWIPGTRPGVTKERLAVGSKIGSPG
jgi:hypothetical protein